MSRAQQAADAIAELASSDPDELARALREFDTRDLVSAVAAGGGGGGGLPDGWTQSGNPADVNTQGGDLELGVGGLNALEIYARDLVGKEVGGVAGSLTLFPAEGTPFVRIKAATTDPSAGAGVAANLGSVILRTNGQLWVKSGAGNTDWTQLGGIPAGDTTIVRVPVAFDDVGLLAGIAIYTPAAGDLIVQGGIWPTTEAWDGTTPTGMVFSQGQTFSEALFTGNMTFVPDTASTGPHVGYVGQFTSGIGMYCLDATPLVVSVNDGTGGDPGSMQGAGEVLLVIVRA